MFDTLDIDRSKRGLDERDLGSLMGVSEPDRLRAVTLSRRIGPVSVIERRGLGQNDFQRLVGQCTESRPLLATATCHIGHQARDVLDDGLMCSGGIELTHEPRLIQAMPVHERCGDAILRVEQGLVSVPPTGELRQLFGNLPAEQLAMFFEQVFQLLQLGGGQLVKNARHSIAHVAGNEDRSVLQDEQPPRHVPHRVLHRCGVRPNEERLQRRFRFLEDRRSAGVCDRCYLGDELIDDRTRNVAPILFNRRESPASRCQVLIARCHGFASDLQVG